jgi:hypothetical protein
MRLTGLVTFSRRGVIVTDIGHEVHRRITNPSSPRIGEDRSRESVYDSLFVPVPADTDAGSHIRLVRAKRVISRACPILFRALGPQPQSRSGNCASP